MKQLKQFNPEIKFLNNLIVIFKCESLFISTFQMV